MILAELEPRRPRAILSARKPRFVSASGPRQARSRTIQEPRRKEGTEEERDYTRPGAAPSAAM
jgi:hypothetical protein